MSNITTYLLTRQIKLLTRFKNDFQVEVECRFHYYVQMVVELYVTLVSKVKIKKYSLGFGSQVI